MVVHGAHRTRAKVCSKDNCGKQDGQCTSLLSLHYYNAQKTSHRDILGKFVLQKPQLTRLAWERCSWRHRPRRPSACARSSEILWNKYWSRLYRLNPHRFPYDLPHLPASHNIRRMEPPSVIWAVPSASMPFLVLCSRKIHHNCM